MVWPVMHGARRHARRAAACMACGRRAASTPGLKPYCFLLALLQQVHRVIVISECQSCAVCVRPLPGRRCAGPTPRPNQPHHAHWLTTLPHKHDHLPRAAKEGKKKMKKLQAMLEAAREAAGVRKKGPGAPRAAAPPKPANQPRQPPREQPRQQQREQPREQPRQPPREQPREQPRQPPRELPRKQQQQQQHESSDEEEEDAAPRGAAALGDYFGPQWQEVKRRGAKPGRLAAAPAPAADGPAGAAVKARRAAQKQPARAAAAAWATLATAAKAAAAKAGQPARPAAAGAKPESRPTTAEQAAAEQLPAAAAGPQPAVGGGRPAAAWCVPGGAAALLLKKPAQAAPAQASPQPPRARFAAEAAEAPGSRNLWRPPPTRPPCEPGAAGGEDTDGEADGPPRSPGGWAADGQGLHPPRPGRAPRRGRVGRARVQQTRRCHSRRVRGPRGRGAPGTRRRRVGGRPAAARGWRLDARDGCAGGRTAETKRAVAPGGAVGVRLRWVRRRRRRGGHGPAGRRACAADPDLHRRWHAVRAFGRGG